MLAFVAARVGEVRDVRRLTGGASRQTWRCESARGPIVVQRQQPTAERDMAVEASAVAAARAVPAPPVVATGTDAAGWSTMITDAVDGETIARRILRDERFAGARAGLATDLGRAAARVHAIDPAAVPLVEAIDPLAAYRHRLDEIGHPHPAFELAFRWLDDHRPPPTGRTAVVHGDLRLGNVIVAEHGLAAVIDWELVHLGDPLEDLGWMCVPAWRFGGPLPVAGVGRRDQLLDAYADESGWRPDPEALRWWEIAGMLRWGVICVMQAERHRSGEVCSHELAAIGRRVCENEHDLFLALEGRW